MAPPPWRVLADSQKNRVDLAMTLCGGQCFRWRPTAQQTFVGVIGRRAYELRETPATASEAGASTGRVRARHDDTVASSGASVVEYRCLGCAPAPAASRSASTPLHRRKRPREDEHADKVGEERMLSAYLSLDVSLPDLWRAWTTANPMKEHPLVAYLTDGAVASRARRGEPLANIRHLRQDLHEVLFSFLCSQNNHVRRITGMVDALCAEYGDPIPIISDEPPAHVDAARTRHVDATHAVAAGLYTFPTLEQLRAASEDRLRALGFGYRSKFIVGSVRAIDAYRSPVSRRTPPPSGSHASRLHTTSCDFYRDLREGLASVQEQRAMLTALPGVGRKVADCVLLFGLGHAELVPVDTHMAKVAAEYLSPTAQRGGGSSGLATRRGPRAATESKLDWQEVVRQWRWGAQRRGKGRVAAGPTAVPRTMTGQRGKKEEGEPALPALSEKHHDAIQEGFVELFGSYAGWAHSILFYKRMR